MNITIPCQGLAKRILGEVTITSTRGASVTVPALWDTGATCCMVTDGVAKKLQLTENGSAKYRHAGGIRETVSYKAMINIQGFEIGEIALPAMADTPHFGMIIGMDVITRGDFHIKNDNGNTVFTFAC